MHFTEDQQIKKKKPHLIKKVRHFHGSEFFPSLICPFCWLIVTIQLQYVDLELQKYFPQLALNPSGQLVKRTHQHMATTGRVSLLFKSRRRWFHGTPEHCGWTQMSRRKHLDSQRRKISNGRMSGRAELVHTSTSSRCQNASRVNK